MYLIEKHHIEINCSETALANHFKNEVGMVFEQHLYPKLEVLFNKYDVKDTVWQIDKLEVKIPSLRISNWKNDVVNTTLNQVETYLKANTPNHTTKAKQIQNNNIVSKNKYYQELLIHYLAQGILPENGITKQLDDVIKHVNINHDFLVVLKNSIDKSEHLLNTIILRWTLNIPETVSHALAELLGSSKTLKILQTIFKNKQTNKGNLFEKYVFWVHTFHEKILQLPTKQSVTKYIIETAKAYFQLSQKEVYECICVLRNEIKPKALAENKLKTLLSFLNQVEYHLKRKKIQSLSKIQKFLQKKLKTMISKLF